MAEAEVFYKRPESTLRRWARIGKIVGEQLPRVRVESREQLERVLEWSRATVEQCDLNHSAQHQ